MENHSVQIAPFIKNQLLDVARGIQQLEAKRSELIQNLLAAKDIDLEQIDKIELVGEFDSLSVSMKGELKPGGKSGKSNKEVKMKTNTPTESK